MEPSPRRCSSPFPPRSCATFGEVVSSWQRCATDAAQRRSHMLLASRSAVPKQLLSLAQGVAGSREQSPSPCASIPSSPAQLRVDACYDQMYSPPARKRPAANSSHACPVQVDACGPDMPASAVVNGHRVETVRAVTPRTSTAADAILAAVDEPRDELEPARDVTPTPRELVVGEAMSTDSPAHSEQRSNSRSSRAVVRTRQASCTQVDTPPKFIDMLTGSTTAQRVRDAAEPSIEQGAHAPRKCIDVVGGPSLARLQEDSEERRLHMCRPKGERCLDAMMEIERRRALKSFGARLQDVQKLDSATCAAEVQQDRSKPRDPALPAREGCHVQTHTGSTPSRARHSRKEEERQKDDMTMHLGGTCDAEVASTNWDARAETFAMQSRLLLRIHAQSILATLADNGFLNSSERSAWCDALCRDPTTMLQAFVPMYEQYTRTEDVREFVASLRAGIFLRRRSDSEH